MPIYEYTCASCGHNLEAMQKMSAPALTDCPECGKSDLKKQISAAAFRLKGSGWYETDFKDSGKKKEAEKKKEATTSSETKTGDSKKDSSKTTDSAKKSTTKTATGK